MLHLKLYPWTAKYIELPHPSPVKENHTNVLMCGVLMGCAWAVDVGCVCCRWGMRVQHPTSIAHTHPISPHHAATHVVLIA